MKRAGTAYDDFVGSLDARVLVSARRFRDLGVSAPRELPDIPPVHLEMREPRAAELRVPTQESLIDAEIRLRAGDQSGASARQVGASARQVGQTVEPI